MQRYKRIFGLFLAVVFFSTCTKTSLRGDYFIFGITTECSTCSNKFLLKNGRLYPENGKAQGKKIKFKNKELTSEKAQLAFELKENLPALLRESSSGRFGCGGCKDGHDLYIEIGENSSSRTFLIEPDTSNIPKELHTYMKQIESVLSQM